jgi:hypothetical protein
VRGSPAGVNKKLLCSFHFLDRLPEVSSQYIQIGKARVRWPFASARHRLPSTGLVYVHAECISVSGSNISIRWSESGNNRQEKTEHTKNPRRVRKAIMLVRIITKLIECLQEFRERHRIIIRFNNPPALANVRSNSFHFPAFSEQQLPDCKPADGYAANPVPKHCRFMYVIILVSQTRHWCDLVVGHLVQPTICLACL